jgi:hypothetical protein
MGGLLNLRGERVRCAEEDLGNVSQMSMEESDRRPGIWRQVRE